MAEVSYSVRAVERALIILKSFNTTRTECTYQDIAHETGIPESTTFKLMKLLAQEGFLSEGDRSGSFRIGIEMYRLGCLYVADKSLIQTARPWLRRLADQTGMTANLGVRHHAENTRILIEQGTSPLSLSTRLGEFMPYTSSALAKALVLDLSPDELEQILPPQPWRTLTAKSITSPQQLIEELDLSRERGYTIDDEEAVEGIKCFGAPLRDANGEIIAAISVTGTSLETNEETEPLIIQRVVDIARRISQELGHQDTTTYRSLSLRNR